MPSYEDAKYQALADKLSTVAVAAGAQTIDQLIAWIVAAVPLDGQANFQNPNASALVAAL